MDKEKKKEYNKKYREKKKKVEVEQKAVTEEVLINEIRVDGLEPVVEAEADETKPNVVEMDEDQFNKIIEERVKEQVANFFLKKEPTTTDVKPPSKWNETLSKMCPSEETLSIVKQSLISTLIPISIPILLRACLKMLPAAQQPTYQIQRRPVQQQSEQHMPMHSFIPSLHIPQ